MTEAAVRIMRSTTQIPFELVIVETESKAFENPRTERFEGGNANTYSDLAGANVYLHRPQRTTLVKDLNAGIDAASGDFVCMTANDIFMKPGWLEGLLECFERFSDCGIASLGVQEVGAFLNHQPAPFIIEGWYGPLIMWRRGWRFDEAFESLACDNDLIMRIYHAGMRAYRNHKVVVLHLNNQTWNGNHLEMAERTKQLFISKWGNSPYWAASMILRGVVGFGREFER